MGTPGVGTRRPPAPPSLYGIADVESLGLSSVVEAVATMARAGIEWIQVRAKGMADVEWLDLLRRCGELRDQTPFAMWVNDRPDLACLAGADGVHLGQTDLPPAAARAAVGESMWIGRSCHDLDQVVEANADPQVDVIALGPIFATQSKPSAGAPVGIECLREARARTRKALVAIGGIDSDRLLEVLRTGADGAAVIGALCRGSVAENSRRLLRLARDRT